MAIETQHSKVFLSVVCSIPVDMMDLYVPVSVVADAAGMVISVEQDFPDSGWDWGPARRCHCDSHSKR